MPLFQLGAAHRLCPTRPPAFTVFLSSCLPMTALNCISHEATSASQKSLFSRPVPVPVPVPGTNANIIMRYQRPLLANRRPGGGFLPVAHAVSIPPPSSHLVMRLKRGAARTSKQDIGHVRPRWGLSLYARKRRCCHWLGKKDRVLGQLERQEKLVSLQDRLTRRGFSPVYEKHRNRHRNIDHRRHERQRPCLAVLRNVKKHDFGHDPCIETSRCPSFKVPP